MYHTLSNNLIKLARKFNKSKFLLHFICSSLLLIIQGISNVLISSYFNGNSKNTIVILKIYSMFSENIQRFDLGIDG